MKRGMLTLMFLMGCSNAGPGVVYTEGDPETDEDTTPPTLTHTPIETSQPIGEDVLITCTAADDDSGVFIVSVWYKQETSTNWEDAQLRQVDNAGNFEGYIPGDDVNSAGMDYYLEAIDGQNNSGFLPEDGEDDPYHFRISAN